MAPIVSRYLEGVPSRARRRASRVLLVWLVLVVLFVCVWVLLGAPPDARPAPRPVEPPGALATLAPALLVLAAFGGALFVVVRRQREGALAALRGEELLSAERFDEAVVYLQARLRRGLAPFPAFQALSALGRCAEAKMDFADAAAIYTAAAGAVPRAFGALGTLHAQVVPIAHGRRAFALAADDRLDEAERELELALGPVALPAARPLAVRARALVLAKRARYKDLLDLLASERRVTKNGLPLRDRLLLRALGAHARRALAATVEGRQRSAAPAPLLVDPDLRPWIARVFPAAAALWEGG